MEAGRTADVAIGPRPDSVDMSKSAFHGGPVRHAWHAVRVPPVVVVSGSPGTGKSTIAAALSNRLRLPLLSIDPIKEAIADVLGLGDEDWSDRVGDAAAEVIFRTAAGEPGWVVEGWWRGLRRSRAEKEFAGCLEVFCKCEPTVVEERFRLRLQNRHPIHRDVINPELLDRVRDLAATVRPLGLGRQLIQVDTTQPPDLVQVCREIEGTLKP